MLKILLIFLLSCGKNLFLKNNFNKNIIDSKFDIYHVYKKKFVDIREYLNYIKGRSSSELEAKVEWLKGGMNKDVNYYKNLLIKDQLFINVLSAAAILRENELFKNLWNIRESLIKTDEKGNNALHYAIYFNENKSHFDICKTILEKNPESFFNKKFKYTLYPIHLAIIKDDIDILNLFEKEFESLKKIKNFENVKDIKEALNEIDKNSLVKILDLAFICGSINSIKFLKRHGFSINNENKDELIMHLFYSSDLLNSNKNKNIEEIILELNKSGENKNLEYLDENRSIDEIILELDNFQKEENLEQETKDNEHVKEDLLTKIFKIRDKKNRTFSMIAARNDNVAVFDYFDRKSIPIELKKGQITCKDNKNRNIFAYAALGGNTEIINKILSLKIILQIKDEELDVNSKDNEGKTSLWYAVIKENIKIIKVLLDKMSQQNIFSCLIDFILDKEFTNEKILKPLLNRLENIEVQRDNSNILEKCILNQRYELANSILNREDLNLDIEKNKNLIIKLIIQDKDDYLERIIGKQNNNLGIIYFEKDSKNGLNLIELARKRNSIKSLNLLEKMDYFKNLDKFHKILELIKVEKFEELNENLKNFNMNFQEPKNKNTIIHYLIEEENIKSLKKILELDVDKSFIQIKNSSNKTPFEIAEENMNKNIIMLIENLYPKHKNINTIGQKQIIKSNSSEKDSVILKKIYLELKKDSLNLGKISSLLRDFEKDEENKNITINSLINTEWIIPRDHKGVQSLMHLAVMSHDPKSLELMRLLKDNMKADVNVRNHLGETPLHLACELGDKDKIRLLLKMGADIKLEDNFDTTPLVAHIEGDNISREVFNEFLGLLSEVNAKIGPELKTILHLVCDNFWKNPESAANIIKMLTREGADFRIRDIRGNTLLHSIVLASISHDTNPNDTINMIGLLIRCGVDPKAMNKDNNRTILHIATEYGAHEKVIEYLTEIVGAIQPSPYKVVEDRFKEMIKSYGNVDIEDEGRRNVIHDTLQTLWIQEDDFTEGNTKFLKLLAALFYAKWTNDKFIPNMDSNNNINIYRDVDRTLSLAPLINLVNNINFDDIDEDLKKAYTIEEYTFDIYKVIPLFSRKLFQINSGTYMEGKANPLTKIKLQKLVSFLPKITNKPEKVRFVINTLLRQFAACEVAITLGLDQIFSYLGETIEENTKIEELIYKYINQLKKNTLLEALKEIYPPKNEQTHFNVQVLKYFANELNLIEEYDDPYIIKHDFNPDIIRDKFYEKYNASLILDYLEKNLMNPNISPKLLDYIQETSAIKNVHLIHKIFFDKEDYSAKEEFIKALLLNLGHIKNKG